MISIKERYGPTALIAGASEGLGAAWAHALAAQGLNLILIARRPDPLAEITRELTLKFKITVSPLTIDLAADDATQQIIAATTDQPIDLLVLNAAASYIGPFLAADPSTHQRIAAVNMLAPLALLHHFGNQMVERRRGGIIIMSSLAGFQGSGYLATYAGTKTFLKVLAESLWYEWRPYNVDVIACCAGATATPNYLATNPGKASPLEPKPQQPAKVVAECLRRIGTTPSFVSGAANKWITFFMQHILSKKAAIRMMSNGLKKMYRIIPILALTPLLLFTQACHAPGQPSNQDTPQDTLQDTLANLPFRNPDLPIDQRVNDLVSRMTLEEKIGQMMNAAPAIPRLGIPEYNWWNECLHGVARAGLATVFPQAIGLGAAWDEPMQYLVATAISDEARAKHHEFIRKGKRLIYQGLTFWSPNINIFRDPRWGRGQETYGEDPYLTGRLAVQFIKGLQGDDPKYFKTIATVKHFAVHSGPEPDRHFFDARPDERDFRETYLPQFEMGIREGGAYSVMCAYNRLYGQACCGSSRLLTTILRNEWGFQGYVVSDCGAIDDIYEHHKIVSTPDSAGALAVKSGCDLECATTFTHLKEAVAKGLVSEQEIDTAVSRLFTARFKLGMFDPADSVKYAKIPYSVVDSKEHKALALEAAHKTIVLLKNAHNTLPLKKDLKTIAIIGPNADDPSMLLGNYNGLPSHAVTPLEGIRDKLGAATQVLYAKGCDLAEGLPSFTRIPAAVLSHNGTPGLQANYYNNKDFTGNILFTTTDSVLDANWGDGAPRSDMDDDNFAVKYSGELTPDRSGNYQLGVITTCKVRLFLDDSLIAFTSYHFRDEYNDPRLRKSVPLNLKAGRKYRLRADVSESYGDARVQLVWWRQEPARSAQLKAEALATARRADAVILCMGLSARLEGEEMDVNIDGFKSGDRTTLDLPKVQENLIRAIAATGKPVIFVLLNGSAVSINWEDQHLPAILEAWYPGQAGGTAIADVLFGDYNPAGRLPVTFYTSVKDLPDFGDYAMAGRTYRYYNGHVLYPFGYGLSYTTFHYDSLQVTPPVKPTDSLHLNVQVSNTGSTEGDEVAQIYISAIGANVPVPIRSLRGFQRIHLQPRQSTVLHFSIAPDAFTIINDQMQRVPLAGKYSIAVGGSQPDNPRPATSNTTATTITLP
jgi:beta-glucosidase